MTQSHAYRGHGLEASLDLAHNLYAGRGTARIKHYHLAGEWHGGEKGPRFLPVPKAEQPPDYHGCVCGTMVVFDAKQTDAPDRWSLDRRYAHQFDRLVWWSEASAVAFFAVECLPQESLFLLRILPGSAWPELLFGPTLSDGHPVILPSDRVIIVRRNEEGWYDWLRSASLAGWVSRSALILLNP